MPFFLLGKNEDDELRLLTPTLVKTRQKALAELSKLTGDPTFTDWDLEVVVVDFDSGVPVLLVRPAGSEAAEEEPEAEEEAAIEESEAEEAEAEPELDEEPETEAQPEAEPEEVAEPEAEAAPEELVEAEDDTAAAVLADETVEVVAEEEPAEGAEPDTEEEAESLVTEEPEGGSLKDALQRTAEHMEATGIVAPESVGPAEPAEVPAEASEDAVTEEAAEEAPAEEAVAEEVTAADAEVASWPWDTATEQPADVAFVLDGLEEPAADDGGSLIHGAVDDEALSASRPVILGAYGDETPTAEPEPLEEAEPPMSADLESVLGDLEQIETEPQVAATDAETDELSDFILDLEQITSVPEAPAPEPEPIAPEPAFAQPAEVSAPEDEYTCSDCVYEETCPNKDQRLPKDCVSFQWK